MLPISPRTDTLFPDTTRVRSADSQQIGTAKNRIHIGRYGQHLAQRLAAAFDGSRSAHVDDGHVGKPVLSHDLGKGAGTAIGTRSEEHTSELQSLMRISYTDLRLQKINKTHK